MIPKHWNRLLAAFMIGAALLLGACRSSAPEDEQTSSEAIAEPAGPWSTARLVGDLSGHDPL